MTGDETGQIRRNGLWLTALIADAAGDMDTAMVATTAAVESFDRAGPSFSGLPDIADEVVFIRMSLRAGRPELAGQALRLAERRAAANPNYRWQRLPRCTPRALVDDDESCLREALHLMDGTERPLLRASALEDLARLVASDRQREGIALLDEALLAYEAAGAEHDAARARRRLRTSVCADVGRLPPQVRGTALRR
jgi:hypothetical protein